MINISIYPRFEKDDIVECIDNKDAWGLTIGKKYKIIFYITDGCVWVTNDDGNESIYLSERFAKKILQPDYLQIAKDVCGGY